MGDEFGKTILGFRGDEPDFSISGLPWTPKFFSEFQRIKGYDIRPYVATFLQGRDTVLTPEQTLARADYYDVFATLFRDGFFKPQGATSASGHGGPMEFMRDPGYPSLMRYTGRMSYLMSMGRPAAEVALLLPSASLWMGDKAADVTFVSTERLLSEHQIDFDIVGEEAIGKDLKTDPGIFISGSGNRYRTVLVPREKLLPGAVFDRLRAFAASGGHVVFLGNAPSMIGIDSDLHARAATAADFNWANVIFSELTSTPTPPAEPPASPPQPMVVPANLISAVQAAVPPPELTLLTPSTALHFAHRELRDASIFLLFNESHAELNNELSLHVRGRRVEVWDPETGENRPLDQAQFEKGYINLSLSMAPYATKVLVVQR